MQTQVNKRFRSVRVFPGIDPSQRTLIHDVAIALLDGPATRQQIAGRLGKSPTQLQSGNMAAAVAYLSREGIIALVQPPGYGARAYNRYNMLTVPALTRIRFGNYAVKAAKRLDDITRHDAYTEHRSKLQEGTSIAYQEYIDAIGCIPGVITTPLYPPATASVSGKTLRRDEPPRIPIPERIQIPSTCRIATPLEIPDAIAELLGTVDGISPDVVIRDAIRAALLIHGDLTEDELSRYTGVSRGRVAAAVATWGWFTQAYETLRWRLTPEGVQG